MNLLSIIPLCLFLTGFLCFSTIESISSPVSLVPIIETPNPEIYAILGEDFSLTFIIIDDNPNSYFLKKDGDLLEFGEVETSKLTFNRTETIGTYVFTLEIVDFSLNNASKDIVVHVDYYGTDTAALSCFFPFILLVLGLLAIPVIYKRKRNKSSF